MFTGANERTDSPASHPVVVISSNDYGHINNNVHATGAPVYAQPDHGHNQLKEPTYAQPDEHTSNEVPSYADPDAVDPERRHRTTDGDPIPYATATDIGGDQLRYNNMDSSYASAYETKPTDSGLSTGLPPYATVHKNRNSDDSQLSFQIRSGFDSYSDIPEEENQQPNEYGQLQQPLTSASPAGAYQKLERGLNKEIVDSAR